MRSRRRDRSAIAVAMRAVLAGALVAPAIAGPWQYREAQEQPGRGPVRIAEVRSSGTVKFALPSGGTHFATLALRGRPSDGAASVSIAIPKARFACKPSCIVLVRFDDAKVEPFGAQLRPDAPPDLLLIDEPQRFVARLVAAKRVRIEAPFVRAGKRVLKFDVSELRWEASSVGLTPTK